MLRHCAEELLTEPILLEQHAVCDVNGLTGGSLSHILRQISIILEVNVWNFAGLC